MNKLSHVEISQLEQTVPADGQEKEKGRWQSTTLNYWVRVTEGGGKILEENEEQMGRRYSTT